MTAARDILSSSPNPHRHKNYVVAITQEITINQQAYLFGLRYIPDKILLNHQGLAGYLEQILTNAPAEPEILAHNILEDVSNEIIPKWIEINLLQEENKSGQNILIIIEDRQPHWENDRLLNRLPALF